MIYIYFAPIPIPAQSHQLNFSFVPLPQLHIIADSLYVMDHPARWIAGLPIMQEESWLTGMLAIPRSGVANDLRTEAQESSEAGLNE